MCDRDRIPDGGRQRRPERGRDERLARPQVADQRPRDRLDRLAGFGVVRAPAAQGGLAELARDPLSNPSVPTDDEVVVLLFDRLPPSFLRPSTREHPARDRLDDDRADVGKDSHAGKDEHHCPEPAGGSMRRRVEPVERGRDDRAVERVQPALVENDPKPDGSRADDDARREEDTRQAAHREGLRHACIVGVWKTRPASAS